jgi:hypothetical protein
MSTAILILAHKNECQLKELLNHLSLDFSIYIHLDKNSNLVLNNQENVNIFKKYRTYWGSFNFVKATILLLRKAFENNYDHYVLISGQDLPIKSNQEIKDYFTNNNKNYIEMYKMPYKFGNFDSEMERVIKYWPIQNFRWKDGKNFAPKIIYKIKEFLLNITVNLKERNLDYDFYGGATWFNLTYDCVQNLLSYIDSNPKYLKRFKYTRSGDEIFFQTLINILNIKINNTSLRYVDWEKGPDHPRTLRMDDYQNIINSDNLFARKFDPEIDNEIIDLIYHSIDKNKMAREK